MMLNHPTELALTITLDDVKGIPELRDGIEAVTLADTLELSILEACLERRNRYRAHPDEPAGEHPWEADLKELLMELTGKTDQWELQSGRIPVFRSCCEGLG